MNKRLIRKLLITFFLVAMVFLSYSKLLDSVAEEYTEQGIERSLIVFAISRSLNGVISVAQGTEVALSPAGVGLTFAPGQILDPVNDLIERFSWVVMVSGASLGIQRLFLEITSSLLVSGFLSLFILLYLLKIWAVFNYENTQFFPVSFLKTGLILLVFIRFSVPVIALLNEGLYLSYLQPQYTEAKVQLVNASDQIKSINESTHGNIDKSNDGMMEQVSHWLDQTKQSLDIEKQMDSLKLAVSDMSHQVINLIVIFVVQTIIFPLLFLWLLVQSAKGIMRRFSI